MKILIANLDPGKHYMVDKWLEKRRTTLHFPIGLGIIAACLKNAGWQFDVYDSYVNGSTEGFLTTIEHQKPDIVLLSGFLGNFSYRFVRDIAYKIKAIHQSTSIIIGGPMASTIPGLLISNGPFDIIVKGEGEGVIVELLSTLENKAELSQIKGIYFKNLSGDIVFTGQRGRIRNLDRSPFPLYDVFPIEAYTQYLKKTGRSWEICASRGCYNHCHFCKRFGQIVAAYSPKLIVEHMTFIAEQYGIDRFNFVDDNFLNHPKRVHEFLALLKNHPRKFQWRFQGRIDSISSEIVKKLVKVGLLSISFGIESGSQQMLNRYGKNLDIKEAFERLITITPLVDVYTSFIVGGPGETWETIKETAQFIKRTQLKNVAVGILTVFPDTVFYDEAKKSGLIKDDETYCLNLGPVYDRPYINMSHLSNEELLKARDMLRETALEFGT